MTDQTESDVLVYFVQKSGAQAIPAESQSALTTADRLTSDFKAGSYFEAEEFSFGIQLADDEGGGTDDSGEQRSYSRWRALSPSTPKPNPPFQAEPKDASFSRLIDTSSALLLKHCLDNDQFDKVVLVKRMRVGSKATLAGTLRMEFSKVWLKAIEWQDGDTIRERCTFKFAAVSVTYMKRKIDGVAVAPWPCFWEGPTYG